HQREGWEPDNPALAMSARQQVQHALQWFAAELSGGWFADITAADYAWFTAVKLAMSEPWCLIAPPIQEYMERCGGRGWDAVLHDAESSPSWVRDPRSSAPTVCRSES